MKRLCAVFTFISVALTAFTFAQDKAKLGPDEMIASLYKAHKADAGPFNQTKSRALVDRYFMKDLAGMIWKDAVASKGEVGAIDFDPLFGSQDPQITDFKISNSGWTADSKFADDDKANVQVTFKNAGKKETVSFAFDQDEAKTRKIYDIRYPNDTSLREIFAAQ